MLSYSGERAALDARRRCWCGCLRPQRRSGHVAELQTLGARATGASFDITEGAALKSWIANVAREFGGIDMLFSNAGAMAQGGDPASWEQNFRLDVLGAVNAFEAARPFLGPWSDAAWQRGWLMGRPLLSMLR
jgi:NAD(P)-dependent dehydrogenase (short-subunit alcohol dehydrogenase family)